MIGDQTSLQIEQSRADYADRRARSSSQALPNASQSPQALESALAALSAEMTAEAIDRKRREQAS